MAYHKPPLETKFSIPSLRDFRPGDGFVPSRLRCPFEVIVKRPIIFGQPLI